MATRIKTLKDANGDILLPRTSSKSVMMGDGITSLEDKISNMGSSAADYEANPGEPGYIQNRTHWKEALPIVENFLVIWQGTPIKLPDTMFHELYSDSIYKIQVRDRIREGYPTTLVVDGQSFKAIVGPLGTIYYDSRDNFLYFQTEEQIGFEETIYFFDIDLQPLAATYLGLDREKIENGLGYEPLERSGGILNSYVESLVVTNGDIDLNLGNVFSLEVGGSPKTISIANAKPGVAHSFTLIVKNSLVVQTVSFPENVKWSGGGLPDLTEANKDYVFSFLSIDGGATWLCTWGGGF